MSIKKVVTVQLLTDATCFGLEKEKHKNQLISQVVLCVLG